MLSVVESTLECLRLSIFFGKLLELGAAFFSYTLVSHVCLLDLLIESTALLVLTGTFSALLLMLIHVHLLELAVD